MEPAVASIVFYGVVIIFCELFRRILDVLYGSGSRPPLSVKGFLTEAIGTLQAISCVYENQLIVKYYGLVGFALAIFLLLTVHRLTNRGAICSPPALLERLILGQQIVDGAAILAAELVGAALAFRLAFLVWSLGLSTDHTTLSETFECTLVHKVPLTYVAAYEFTAVFLIRSFVGLTARRKPYWTPYAAAAAISIGIPTGFALVGPVALNPIIAFGRLSGCKGLTWYEHFVTYWLAPISGWIVALITEKLLFNRSKKTR